MSGPYGKVIVTAEERGDMDTYLDHNVIETSIGARYITTAFYRGEEKVVNRTPNQYANPSRTHERAADDMVGGLNEDGLPVRITGRGFVGGGTMRAVHTIEVVVDLPRITEWTCTRCGSNRVLNDAWVSCNDQDDVRIFDATFCEECDGECNVEQTTIKSEK